MIGGLAFGLFIAFASAFAAVVLGRNLTRSIFAAVIALGWSGYLLTMV